MKSLIALLGEYDPELLGHKATAEAIKHSATHLGNSQVEAVWVSTAEINKTPLSDFAGIWITPGKKPYLNNEAMLEAIRCARENGIPCLGTCRGFQYMIIEYARNVLGFKNAEHQENDSAAPCLVIRQLPYQLARRKMTISFLPGSQVAGIYGEKTAIERYFCQCGVSLEMEPFFGGQALRSTGADEEGEFRVIELMDHPFFIGTLFVPQIRSTEVLPHPLITAFVQAATRREISKRQTA